MHVSSKQFSIHWTRKILIDSIWFPNRILRKFVPFHCKKFLEKRTWLLQSGWILPKMCVHGTLTRRATENTWLVATNAQTKAIGTELKCMIRAPDGFKFVGADVDSEELWIAALIGDSSCGGEGVKGHGVTPLGWMVVAGDKKDKTDMHSFTAGKLNLDRESAKVGAMHLNILKNCHKRANSLGIFLAYRPNFVQTNSLESIHKFNKLFAFFQTLKFQRFWLA